MMKGSPCAVKVRFYSEIGSHVSHLLISRFWPLPPSNALYFWDFRSIFEVKFDGCWWFNFCIFYDLCLSTPSHHFQRENVNFSPGCYFSGSKQEISSELSFLAGFEVILEVFELDMPEPELIDHDGLDHSSFLTFL
ncbi:hypothetical protein L1987_87833 [Smallanthus sonchifolius]|nr:hypothetical protein L1987_87833 [Smallanthus sonchifolius]